MSTLTLEAVLDANNKPFIKVMNDSVRASNKASKTVETGWGKANKAIGGFGAGHLGALLGAGALASGVRTIANMAGEVSDLSDAVSLSTDDFQRFNAAIVQTGGDGGTLTKAMNALNGTLEDAKGGSTEARKKLTDLGFSLDEIATLSPRDALLKVAEALRKTGADGKTTAQVVDLLGAKVAVKLIPALKGGSEAFLDVGRAATVMSQTTVENIDKMDDAWGQFKRNVAGGVANMFVDTTEGFKNLQHGGGFLDGIKSLMSGGISTPAVSKNEISAASKALKMQTKMTKVDSGPATSDYGPRPFWKRSRPTMSKLTGNEEMFGPKMSDMDNSAPRSNNIGGFYTSPLSVGNSGALTSGGLTTGGLGVNSGLSGDAYGKVRHGDAAKARAAARDAKKDKDPQLTEIAGYQKELVEVWTGKAKK